ncbi:hypothetical protein V8C35DRAFT_279628 [Trichoderma chlorosporum]
MAPVPPPEARTGIAAKLNALTKVIESDPQFSPVPANTALYWIWDFARRTEYMLSEVDGIRQPGYEFKHKGQIKITRRGEDAAEELYIDTFTRSATLEQLVNGPPVMRAMMGVGGDVSPEIQIATRDAVEAFHSKNWE